MNRIIRYATPKQEPRKLVVPEEESAGTVYETIEWFSRRYGSAELPTSPDQAIDLKMSQVVNLHNLEGVTNLQTMRELMAKIKKDIDIMNLDNGAPNVHLAKVGADWVAINGHHTIMAYMLCGKTEIRQLPYLVIEDSQTGEISTDEILAVFNQYSSQIDPQHWQDTVLDWAAPAGHQLTSRIQHNMGELTEAFLKRYGTELGL